MADSTPRTDPALPADSSSGPYPLDRVQSLLLNVQSLDATLTDLAGLATQVVGATSCGITVRYDGQLLTVGSSDAQAESLDESQYRAGDGPCLQALRTAQAVEVLDARAETRWPSYMPTAVDAGLRCSLSLPLLTDTAASATARAFGARTSGPPTVGAGAFGAMNVYGFDHPQMFADPERRQLELFAARAAGTLQVARRLTRDNALLAQMEEALTSRTTIDQALGIIIAQQYCTATAAFDLLRRESQNSRRRLRDIAADLVEHTSGHPTQPGRGFTAI